MVTYLLDVLKSVYDEALNCYAAKHLVVINHDRVDSVEALNLGQQNEGVEVVVSEYEFLKFGKFPQFFQILVVHYQVKANVV